jgi:hypothetical protein
MHGGRPPGAAAIRRRQMRTILIVLGVVWLACAARPAAQALPREYAQFMSKDYQELMTAMTAAQAKAIRSGDEAMSCAAIEKELVTSMNDPAIQGYAAKMSGIAQKDLAAAAAARGTMTPQAAAALLTALGSGTAMPSGPAVGLPPTLAGTPAAIQQAQIAALAQAGIPGDRAQPQAQLQALQDPTAYLKALMPILPQMMRAQHLVGLALTRSCPWAFGGFPGAAALTPAAR